MTISDAINELYKWFENNDTFKMSKDETVLDDTQKLVLISEDKETTRLIVKEALDYYEKQELAKKIVGKKYTYWVLSKPFSSYSQTVTIEPKMALAIAKLINEFCDAINDQTDQCNAASITSKDIQSLLIIAYHFANKNS